tara:strand:+ start:881 stop:1441 length:561 start_codon:yes stop_codon:yes gene_type:complete
MKKFFYRLWNLLFNRGAKEAPQEAPISITEGDEVHLAWYEEAREQTLDSLPGFLKKLTSSYRHDYGTICHAVAAAALAAAYSIDHSDQGGITGFQGSMIGHLMFQKWNHIDHPYKILYWDKMLYPQYAYAFSTEISQETWEWLQEKAKERIAENGLMAERVRNHMQLIADGVPPFGWSVEQKGGEA